ncbi:MAG TPA: serine protease [Blastocatellia bacterium]|nr:serine protease [Blastocatellia bacterium]
MQTILLVGLSGSEKGRVRLFTQDSITFGTSPRQDVDLSSLYTENPNAETLARVFVRDDGGQIQVEDPVLRVEVRHNGNTASILHHDSSTEVQDGDRLEFHGPNGTIVFQFQVLPEEYQTASLVKQPDPEISAAHHQVHPLTATLFVKELVRSLWAEVGSRERFRLKGALLIIATLIVAVVGFNVYQNVKVASLIGEFNRYKQEQANQKAELDKQRAELDKQREEVDKKLSTFTVAQRIMQEYHAGVPIIVGGYTYVDKKTGKELRYRDANDTGEPLGTDQGFPASIDGQGPVVVEEFTGTGFVVDNGLLLTNRHVVEPWLGDELSQRIIADGFQPHMSRLIAYFPGIKTPFPLEVKKRSTEYDVALCSFDTSGYAIPVLPLASPNSHAQVGEPVVLLGYPTGVDGLLQRLDENLKDTITHRAGRSVDQVTRELADFGQIRPLVTQGNITDMPNGRLVHSADTTEGGSGGPLFNPDGKVIGINSAVLRNPSTQQDFRGSNFGIPISVGIGLIESAKPVAVTK